MENKKFAEIIFGELQSIAERDDHSAPWSPLWLVAVDTDTLTGLMSLSEGLPERHPCRSAVRAQLREYKSQVNAMAVVSSVLLCCPNGDEDKTLTQLLEKIESLIKNRKES